MGYMAEIRCDKCGDGYYWTGRGPNHRVALQIARDQGWQVGKTGWFCPKCRTRKRSSKNGKDER